LTANEALERLASFGLSTNMILYLTREYGMDAASGAQILFLYSAAGNFMPIIGAFLADTYVGRYPMIGFGCIASLLVTLFLSNFASSLVSLFFSLLFVTKTLYVSGQRIYGSVAILSQTKVVIPIN
jgi:peptide/histidine transporter 3/4